LIDFIEPVAFCLRYRLTEDITFVYAPSPQNPPIYSDALIHCRVSGEPEPEVSWKFRGHRIPPSTLTHCFLSMWYDKSKLFRWGLFPFPVKQQTLKAYAG